MTPTSQRLLDPHFVSKLARLDLRARLVVDGFLTGLHKSPYHGFSVEFAEHRQYMPGDPLRHLDWKVLAKSDRKYLKQYEEETNLVCWLLLDISESMRYGSTEVSKYDYACFTAAALAYLILHQQDSVGLITFDDQPRKFLKPSSQPSQLKEIVKIMNAGLGREKTQLAPIFHELADAQVGRRAECGEFQPVGGHA